MSDLGFLGAVTFDWAFVTSFLTIVMIDLILAGDNAVVIAMAVRCLPAEQRTKGILYGSGAAVLLRVLLTFFISQLLQLNYIKLAGGVLILWIALKLLMEGSPDDDQSKEAACLSQAIKIIVLADITMSTDNMLAVAGAAHGNLFLLLFGLGLSIPFIVFTSNLLSKLMDRYPVIITIGAAILGKVGGEMIITDPVVFNHILPSKALQYGVEIACALGVVALGHLLLYRERLGEAAEDVPDLMENSEGEAHEYMEVRKVAQR